MFQAEIAAQRRASEPADAFAWRQWRRPASAASYARLGAIGTSLLRSASALGFAGVAAGALIFAHPLATVVKATWAGPSLRVEQASSRLSSDGHALVVEGELVNHSNRTVASPLLRLAVRSVDRTEIFAWTARADEARLAPGARTRFTSRLAAPPTGGADVAVALVATAD